MDGGGILSGTLFKTPADATIINSTISGNSAPDFGGGIAGGYWRVTIVNSTIGGTRLEIAEAASAVPFSGL